MNLTTLSNISIRIALVLLVTLMVATPLGASAATSTPTCELTLTTDAGTATTKKSGTVLIEKGEELRISWKSSNAKTAEHAGKKIAQSGTATVTPTKSTTYSYRFTSGSKKVECKVAVKLVTGSITTSSLSSDSSKPTLSGTASGAKTVVVVVRKEGSTKVLYKSKQIKVRGGTWKTKVTKNLPDGRYDVTLTGGTDALLNTITAKTLTIGKETKDAATSKGTLVVGAVPLLFGGTARANASVPVSYLQITNTGKESVTLEGFWVKQQGSASTNAIVALSTVDDKGGSRGFSAHTDKQALFKGGSAFAPTNATFAPGQMRLFTIKATMAQNVSSHLGTQLKIDVVGLESNGSDKGPFPIRGTTWTILN